MRTKRPPAEPAKSIIRLEVKLSAALYDAVAAAAGRSGETLGALCRRALAREIGKPELGESRPRGRPVESDNA